MTTANKIIIILLLLLNMSFSTSIFAQSNKEISDRNQIQEENTNFIQGNFGGISRSPSAMKQHIQNNLQDLTLKDRKKIFDSMNDLSIEKRLKKRKDDDNTEE